MNILDRVREIVALESGRAVADIQSTTRFVDLGMDSLEIVNLIMELEDEFNVGLKDELQILTVEDAVKYIVKAQVA